MVLDRKLRRDWVSDRDLGVKYGRGAERVDKTDKESENRMIDSKLHVLECEIHHSRACRIAIVSAL